MIPPFPRIAAVWSGGFVTALDCSANRDDPRGILSRHTLICFSHLRWDTVFAAAAAFSWCLRALTTLYFWEEPVYATRLLARP